MLFNTIGTEITISNFGDSLCRLFDHFLFNVLPKIEIIKDPNRLINLVDLVRIFVDPNLKFNSSSNFTFAEIRVFREV